MTQESSYSSMLDGTQVSMNALLGALDNTSDISTIKKRLSELEKGLAAPSYVEKKDIQMILVKHGTSDQAADQIETDELGSRDITPEEIREKQAELAKVKALMFYEQMKRHRLNKIKSKAYRSIHKRQRLRKNGKNQGGGADDDDEEDAEEMTEEQKEKNAFDRVKERMDMRHKNTSKWAKMALLHGHADKNLRTAYHESVLLGQELTQRMHEDVGGKGKNAATDDDDVYDMSSSTTQGGLKRKSVTQSTAQEMKDILDDSTPLEVDGKYRKLFDMDFMKKAVDQKRERAREDAESVLREIAQMENADDSDDERVSAPPKAVVGRKRGLQEEDSERVAQAKSEVKGLLGRRGEGSLMSMSGKTKNAKISSSSLIVDSSSTGKSASSSDFDAPGVSDEVDDNPWLMAPTSGGSSAGAVLLGSSSFKMDANKSSSGAAKLPTKKAKKEMIVVTPSVVTPVAIVAPVVSTTKTNNKLPARVPLLMQKSQADLVKMAFSGPDLEAEFNAFKDREIDAEMGVDEKRNNILNTVKAGWGDWAGPGASEMVSQKIQDKRQKLLTQVQSENNKKKLVRKDNKILNVHINERRIKTASKYKIADLPHPFTSWEQYERSLQMPLGEDWNASNVVKSSTQPEIKMRAGRVVEPIKLVKKKTAAQAK
eukprot:gene21398-27428_t